jgi:hypothetical protein
MEAAEHKFTSFLRENWLVFCTASLALGGYIFQISALEKRVATVEHEGSTAAKRTQWVVDSHDKQIAELKTDLRANADKLSNIDKSVGVIREWVDDQRRRALTLHTNP